MLHISGRTRLLVLFSCVEKELIIFRFGFEVSSFLKSGYLAWSIYFICYNCILGVDFDGGAYFCVIARVS